MGELHAAAADPGMGGLGGDRTASGSTSSAGLAAVRPSTVTRPASMAARALARLSNRPRSTRSWSSLARPSSGHRVEAGERRAQLGAGGLGLGQPLAVLLDHLLGRAGDEVGVGELLGACGRCRLPGPRSPWPGARFSAARSMNSATGRANGAPSPRRRRRAPAARRPRSGSSADAQGRGSASALARPAIAALARPGLGHQQRRPRRRRHVELGAHRAALADHGDHQAISASAAASIQLSGSSGQGGADQHRSARRAGRPRSSPTAPRS